jgi:anti-anti-sigma regulatory factor
MDPVQIVQQTGETRLVFGAVVEVAKAQALHALLSRALQHSTPIVLDTSHVERIDTASIQLLVSFCRAARARGTRLGWHTVSPALQQASLLLGLGSQIGETS